MQSFDIAILAGGFGSRSKDPTIPKLLQVVDGKTRLIDQLAKELAILKFEKIHFLLGHLADETMAVITEHFPSASVSVRRPAGTNDALKFGSLEESDKPVLVIPGDLLIRGDLNSYMGEFLRGESDASFMIRSTDHPKDSDVVSLRRNRTINRFFLRGEPRAREEFVWGLTGIVALRRYALNNLPTEGNLTEGLCQLWRDNRIQLSCKVTSDFYLDTGTPERLMRASMSFRSGALQRRGRAGKSAIFLDRDGTLIRDIGTQRKRIFPDEVNVEVFMQIRRANQLGIPVFIVTNQPGVAKNEITFADVERTFADLQAYGSEHEARFDDYRYCPHHPDKGFMGENIDLKLTCECRKPSPGMLLDLAETHGVNLEESVVIGDSWRDAEAAAATKSKFFQATPKSLGKALSKAINELA